MALPTISGETLDIRSPRPISPDSADLSSSNPCSEHEPHHIGVPDSGRRAWLVVFGGFLNFTASFGAFVPGRIPSLTDICTRPPQFLWYF